jgi:hypothetical protein
MPCTRCVTALRSGGPWDEEYLCFKSRNHVLEHSLGGDDMLSEMLDAGATPIQMSQLEIDPHAMDPPSRSQRPLLLARTLAEYSLARCPCAYSLTCPGRYVREDGGPIVVSRSATGMGVSGRVGSARPTPAMCGWRHYGLA